MVRLSVVSALLLFLGIGAGARGAAPTCVDALREVRAGVAEAAIELDAAREIDGEASDLEAAHRWHTAHTLTLHAMRALQAIDSSTCDAESSASIERLLAALAADRDASDDRFRQRQPGACAKLFADSRAEMNGLEIVERNEERKVYIAMAMGHEYKMAWRVNFAKEFSCPGTRDLFDESRDMSGSISAALGKPRPGACEGARKLAAEREAAGDSPGFITYAHVALHYADCDAKALLASDPGFRDLYERYHELAPKLYGSIYD